jgi:hypothetical protein
LNLQEKNMAALSRRKHKQFTKTLDQLVSEGAVTADSATNIARSVVTIPFDWKRLAKYAVMIAVISILMAVVSVLSDVRVLEVLTRLFTAPDAAKAVCCAIAASLLFWRGTVRRKNRPERVITTEAAMLLGVLFTAASVSWLGTAMRLSGTQVLWLIFSSSLFYGALAIWLQSKLIWCFALLTLGAWMGAETGYSSDYAAYWLGLNYPLRFALFGTILTCGSLVMHRNQRLRPLQNTSRNLGLLYLFISLWVLSIFGNYGDLYSWFPVRQIELFHWSLIFGLASGAAIWIGCKWDDAACRGFGLTFLLINLYTRFFEFFWQPLHKAVFFALLGLSFWLLGKWAEQRWIKGRLALGDVESCERSEGAREG